MHSSAGMSDISMTNNTSALVTSDRNLPMELIKMDFEDNGIWNVGNLCRI